jgi:RimJ/RimL family protein N-acetyltransferase
MALVARNQTQLKPWFSDPVAPDTADERRKLMAADLAPVELGNRHWWMIEFGGELAGTIDIHRILRSTRSGSVGYWLDKDFTGKGIATNSLRAILDWAFSELNFNRIEIECTTRNQASSAVPERLGIRRESILRQSNNIRGDIQDMALYAALADNWPPKPPKIPLPSRQIQVDDEVLLRKSEESDREAMWKALDAGRDYIVEYKGELAGTAGFGAPNHDNGIEIGYWVRQDLQGRGIITRTVSALIDMAIVQMGMHRVTIRAATSNLSSRAIPERLGFAHEGTMREASFVNDEYLDLEIYSILDHEWLKRSQNA